MPPNTRMLAMTQGRHDRPSDEELGDVHGRAPAAAPTASLTSTLAPGHEAELTVGHHRLADLHAAIDDRIALVLAGHLHGTQLGRTVVPDHVDEGPLLARLHRCCRHHHAALLLLEHELDVDELAGPEALILVWRRSPSVRPCWWPCRRRCRSPPACPPLASRSRPEGRR